MLRRAHALLLAAIIAAGCADGIIDPANRIRIVAGGSGSDTVLAMATPIVVEVRSRGGDLVRGARVVFQTPAAGEDFIRRGMYVCSIHLSRCAVFWDEQNKSVENGFEAVTDSGGRATATVQFGIVAGSARVDVTVPELGLETTARFTTLPGKLARIIPSVRRLESG